MSEIPNQTKIKTFVGRCSGYLGILFWIAHPVLGEEVHARLHHGTHANGHLRGQTAEELRFVVQGKARTLRDFEQIEFPRSSPALKNATPARVFHLVGGETITAELERFADDQMTLLWRGHHISVPKNAVLAIDQLQREVPLLFDDFDAPQLPISWKAIGDVVPARLEERRAIKFLGKSSLTHSLEQPLSESRLSAAFFDPNPGSSSNTMGLELHFGDDTTTSTLTIQLASQDEYYGITHPPSLRMSKQPFRRAPGWRCVTVLFDETRFQVLIDSHLLASGRPPLVPLQSFRVFSDPPENLMGKSLKEFWIDSVQLSKGVPDQDLLELFSLDRQCQVLLQSGEWLFGNLLTMSGKQLRVDGAFGELDLPWSQVRRVVFAEDQNKEPSALEGQASPMGWQAGVTFQRFTDHPYQPADRLTATILAANDSSLTLAHPWLGTCEIPQEQVDFIRPKFYGQLHILSPESRHLGNQIKLDFLHKEPPGNQWQGEFLLETIPLEAVFCISAVELEPAGQGTPPGSRHLPELRNGGLGTEILLNGTSLGRLNDRISRKSNRESPQEIRIKVPANRLKAGKNNWAIRQSSLRNNPIEFDDCELGPIVLEIEKTMPD